MLYIDKNYIEMFGSVERALTAAAEWRQLKKVVQIKGKLDSIPSETRQALSGGGDVLMIDTGQISDLTACIEELCRLGGRNQVQVAFSGRPHPGHSGDGGFGRGHSGNRQGNY